MLSAVALLVVVAVVLMGRGTRRDRFGRVVPAGAGRPVKPRPCGCPARKHLPTCEHAGQVGRPEMGIDRARRAARRAARAVAARVARIKVKARSLRQAEQDSQPGWLRATIAEHVYRTARPDYRAFMWSRLTGTCAVCGEDSTHTVSTLDIRQDSGVIRCLCAGCSLLVLRRD